MNPDFLAIAAAINALWTSCLSKWSVVIPFPCPTDAEVAAIIERHLSESRNA